MKEIHIAFSTDQFYLKPTCIAMESVLLARTGYEDYYHFHILMPVDEIDAAQDHFEKIQCKYDFCTIRRIGIKDTFKNASLPTEHITEPTYYRLLLSELINEQKCIYLDSDIVVCRDIAEMFDMDIDNYDLGGVIEPSYAKNKNYAAQIGIPSTSSYINAGVLLLNLEQMRKDKFTEEALKLIGLSLPSSDQDIINRVAYSKIKLLPLKYNMLTVRRDFTDIVTDEELEEAVNRPVILHYAYPEKPWECPDIDQADKWWKVCRKSFLFDSYLEEQKYNLFYCFCYNVIKNQRLWKIDRGSPEWFEEVKNYRNCYVYGAGQIGESVVTYLIDNGIQITKVLVSDLEGNKKNVQGIPVEEFTENVEEDALIFVAVSRMKQLQIRRKLFQHGRFYVFPIYHI